MYAKRIIPCLDVKNGRVVKGMSFVNLVDAGDPVESAMQYDKQGADELVFLDITASSDSRNITIDMVEKVANSIFIPFTVGGGIRSVEDFNVLLRAGADKVSVNSAAVHRPELISEAAYKFGSQCVVAAIDAKRNGDSWEVYVNGGRTPVGMDAIEWAVKCEKLGAGEILLTSMDEDGQKKGYDIAIKVKKLKADTTYEKQEIYHDALEKAVKEKVVDVAYVDACYDTALGEMAQYLQSGLFYPLNK